MINFEIPHEEHIFEKIFDLLCLKSIDELYFKENDEEIAKKTSFLKLNTMLQDNYNTYLIAISKKDNMYLVSIYNKPKNNQEADAEKEFLVNNLLKILKK